MQTSRKLTQALLAIFAPVVLSASALAADPGLLYPPTSEVSDQKAGSVLFYNFYTSSATNSKSQDTDISITNTNNSESVAVHIYFVDGSNCSMSADFALCLMPNQTTIFLVSNFDPGVTGYIVAMAVKPVTGRPLSFNYLIGSEYVKLASGHAASLDAEAVSALYTGVLESSDMEGTATLNFDGIVYNRVPRVLAFDNIRSPVDGNSALLIVNRVGGDLQGGTSLGPSFFLLHDDVENPFSYSSSGTAGSQIKADLLNNLPRFSPPLSSVIPSGHTGWMKFWTLNGYGILGAVINFNKKADTGKSAFNGGRNLHHLTLTTDSLIIPVFQSQC